ncbi:MAG: hypothetical protein RLN62_03050 [Rickettsiales bacterium]
MAGDEFFPFFISGLLGDEGILVESEEYMPPFYDNIDDLLAHRPHDGNYTAELEMAREDAHTPDYGEHLFNVAVENDSADADVLRRADYLRSLEPDTEEYINARDTLLYALYFADRIKLEILLAEHSDSGSVRAYLGV